MTIYKEVLSRSSKKLSQATGTRADKIMRLSAPKCLQLAQQLAHRDVKTIVPGLFEPDVWFTVGIFTP